MQCSMQCETEKVVQRAEICRQAGTGMAASVTRGKGQGMKLHLGRMACKGKCQVG